MIGREPVFSQWYGRRREKLVSIWDFYNARGHASAYRRASNGAGRAQKGFDVARAYCRHQEQRSSMGTPHGWLERSLRLPWDAARLMVIASRPFG